MANAYITEAFKRLNMLDEDVFDVTDDGIQELKDFEDDSETDETVDIIDPEAENEDELEDSYVGKVILDCCVCHSKIYKNKEEVHLSDDETIANADEECPYCYSTDGFKVIGEVAEFSKGEEEKEDDGEGEEDKVEVDDEVEVKDEDEEVVEESAKKTRKGKALKESFKRRNLKESWGDVYQDLVDRAKSWIDDGDDLDEAVNRALDDGLIYTSDIIELGVHYGVIDGSQVVSDMYEDLFNDIYSEVSDYYDEAHENDDEDVDESLKKKSCKGGKCKSLKEAPIYDLSPQYDSRNSFYGKAKVDTGADNKGNKLYSYNTLVAELKDGKPVVYGTYSATTLRHIKDWLKQNGFKADSAKQIMADYGVKDESCKEAVSKRDDIDAEADDKKERAKKTFARAKDDADADRDYRLKKGITRKDEACKGKKVKEDLNEVTVTTDDTHMEMTADEDGKVTVTTEPVHKEDGEAEEVIAPIEDETKIEIENGSKEDEEGVEDEEEVEMDIDDFSTDEFDELGESFLKKSYNNVDAFKTTGVTVKGNSLKVEGLITFKSGAKKKTHFVFESKDMSKRGKYRLIGENLQLSRGHKSFTIIGSVNNKKFVSESLNYNYRASDANGKSQRVYGTVRVSKK